MPAADPPDDPPAEPPSVGALADQLARWAQQVNDDSPIQPVDEVAPAPAPAGRHKKRGRRASGKGRGRRG